MKKIFKKLSIVKIPAIVLLIVLLLMGGLGASLVAASEITPPSFPTCESKIFSSNGDRAHYDNGTHGVVGVGNLVGRDDVYTLSNGNFLQCYCPASGSKGIQSNWWNTGIAGLGSEQINLFRSLGWFYEQNGADWNLLDDPYLIQNRDFSCTQPTPTPTGTPTITPTPGPESKCWQLEASVTQGTAPLTVKFTAHADDPATGGKIKQYKFFFDDNSDNQPSLWFQTSDTAYHRYEKNGTYFASLNIQDFAGNWRGSEECRVKITVGGQPQVLPASTTSELPSTGLPVVLLASLLPLGIAGKYLYRRFRLV